MLESSALVGGLETTDVVVQPAAAMS